MSFDIFEEVINDEQKNYLKNNEDNSIIKVAKIGISTMISNSSAIEYLCDIIRRNGSYKLHIDLYEKYCELCHIFCSTSCSGIYFASIFTSDLAIIMICDNCHIQVRRKLKLL